MDRVRNQFSLDYAQLLFAQLLFEGPPLSGLNMEFERDNDTWRENRAMTDFFA